MNKPLENAQVEKSLAAEPGLAGVDAAQSDSPTSSGATAVGGATADPLIAVRKLHVHYGNIHAVRGVSLDIGAGEVVALIGPSGCGKTAFIRCINRMNDTVENARVSGEVRVGGLDIYAPDIDPVVLRARVGMVFQKPNPFPKSVYDNVAYGPRVHGLVEDRAELDHIVYSCLERVGLLGEVEDRMQESGTGLSGGQQQRLCLARTLAVDPEVILMDEPCSALDPIATARIEDLIDELSQNYTIVIVTHSMQQAARVSRRVAFFNAGELVEVNETDRLFTNPSHRLTEDYITGRIG